jgi:hypothetical protein
MPNFNDIKTDSETESESESDANLFDYPIVHFGETVLSRQPGRESYYLKNLNMLLKKRKSGNFWLEKIKLSFLDVSILPVL